MPGKRKRQPNPNSLPTTQLHKRPRPPASTTSRPTLPTAAPRPTTALNPATLPQRTITTIHNTLRTSLTKQTTHLFRALKKARNFETQKLIKRLKTARDATPVDADLVRRLEEELEAVKRLNHGEDVMKIAEAHAKKTVGKQKAVVRSGLVPEGLLDEEGRELEGAALKNVVARLLGSKGVVEISRALVTDVRTAVGLEEEVKGKKGEAKAAEKEEEEAKVEEGNETDSTLEDDEAREMSPLKKVPKNSTVRFAVEEADSDDNEDDEEAEESGDENADPWDLLDKDDAFAEFEERLGASSDEDSGDDSEDAHDPLARSDDEWSGSENELGPSDDEDDEPAPPPKKSKAAEPVKDKKEKKEKKEKSTKPAPAASSKFLPSLMGGYVAGDNSDSEDPEAEYYKTAKKGPAQKKERKNRMGQQARRALAERKYGKGAAHLQEGAIKPKKEEPVYVDRKEEQRVKERKKLTDGVLHPSWEAARKKKEAQELMAQAIKEPKGKKITFD